MSEFIDPQASRDLSPDILSGPDRGSPFLLPGGAVAVWNSKKIVFLVTMLETFNVEISVAKAGVEYGQGLRWLKCPMFSSLLEEKKERLAKAKIASDPAYSAAMAYDVLEGKKELNRTTVKVWDRLFQSTHGDKLGKVLEQATEWEITAKKSPSDRPGVSDSIEAEVVEDGGKA